nr:PIN domain-containing protein [Pseudomonas syringae]
MILLDTNVISEPQRREPNAHVLDWIDAQALETLYLSTITVAELRAGIALMPVGKRQDSLRENLEKHLLPMFANRVLSFDMTCTKLMPSCWPSPAQPGWRSKRQMPSLQPSPSPTASPSPPVTLALLRLPG